jgi:hypothetical protein
MNADKRRLKQSSYRRLSAFICGQFAFGNLLIDDTEASDKIPLAHLVYYE